MSTTNPYREAPNESCVNCRFYRVLPVEDFPLSAGRTGHCGHSPPVTFGKSHRQFVKMVDGIRKSEDAPDTHRFPLVHGTDWYSGYKRLG